MIIILMYDAVRKSDKGPHMIQYNYCHPGRHRSRGRCCRLTEREEISLQIKMQENPVSLDHNSQCPDTGSADAENVPSPKGITSKVCVKRTTKYPSQGVNGKRTGIRP